MKVRQVLKLLKADDWYELPQGATGHRQFKHATRPGKVTIFGKPSDDIDRGTLKSIYEQAGWGKPE